jgi:RNA polymerase sigma-70 factor (ECF subfamily)
MTTMLQHPTARVLPDDRLVALVRAGQDHAFDAIVARYEARLTAYARTVLGGAHHDAEEAVQDAFVRGFSALREHPDREIALRPWLYTIVRNACLDRLRKPQRTVDLTAMEAALSDLGADPVEHIARQEQLQALVRDLGDLPTRQRTALLRHELEGRSHESIAAELEVSVGASKALVCRARHGLQAMRDAA